MKNKKYGDLPFSLGIYEVECPEMMFYQYLPIKMKGRTEITFEDRLNCFQKIIGNALCDFVGNYGLSRFVESYVYLTAKRMYAAPGCTINRPGWHSDGFMTDDINYIWCDRFPTIFNSTNFNLSQDDQLSLFEMDTQAKPDNNVIYRENELLRLDQYNIHKVDDQHTGGMRTFVKISISRDKYDLAGNSHNYKIDYNWDMRNRSEQRNIPQNIK